MRVGVALQEALTNALYHGNLEVSSDLRQEDERVFYRRSTSVAGRPLSRPPHPRRGRARPRPGRLPRPRRGARVRHLAARRPIDPEDLMRVGGRGILLIRTFMDEVAYNATGNEITLIKRRKP